MTASLSWYLASSLLGWLTFPLVFRLFPALADRGYTLARAGGILFWGWVFWLLGTLGVLRNDLGGLLFAFLIVIALSVWAFLTEDQTVKSQEPTANSQESTTNRQPPTIQWLKSNKRLILTTELLFLLAFAFMAFVRANNPEATGTEKPMELAFINATLRSPTLPPNDPWMSGYSISYYHFGYILTAMFARLTDTAGSVAFNLMSALVFALAAIGSYGILYNLLVAYKGKQVDTYTSTHVVTENLSPNSQLLTPNASSFIFHPSSFALLAPLFLLILSNLEGFLEVIHGLGWFWTANSQSLTANSQQPLFNFWTWLNIKDLVDPPSGNAIPQNYWWWWRASRVVQDFDLLGAPQEVIDEFPFFSFLLGDLHPHVLALPFNMLGIGVALNLFLDGWRGIVNFLEYKIHTAPRDFFFAALVLGGLAFLNTWDILPAGLLIVGAYILTRVRADGWSWSRLEDAFLLGLPLAITAIFLYLPFYIGFSSQAGGILPNLVNPTRGAHLWVMWATLLLPLFAWLIYLTRARETRPRFGTALILTLSLILFLWLFSWLLAFIAQLLDPTFTAQYLTSQGQADFASFFTAVGLRRLAYLGGLIAMAAIIWLTLSHLLGKQVDTYTRTHVETSDTFDTSTPDTDHWSLNTDHFVLLLTLLASLLILIPDFVYLRDYFGYRINTVFKFYYQGWQLWSIAAAFGTVILLQNLRGVWNVLWRVTLFIILVAGLAYPVLALPNKTNNFNPPFDPTLDSASYLDRSSPEDAAVVRYLQTAPMGVVAEAVGGSYSGYARIATHSGVPTVIGWPWHEFQWRGSWDAHGSREADIKLLYETPDWETAKAILEKYNITYVVVGFLERTTYDVNEAKFQRNLVVLFQAGSAVVYGVP